MLRLYPLLFIGLVAAQTVPSHFQYQKPPLDAPVHSLLKPHMLAGRPLLVGSAQEEVRGVVLMFHGCNNDLDNWMFFPEEKKMLETLTRNQLLPIALPSALSLQKSSRKCWHQKPLDVRNPDVDMAIKAIDWVREQPHLKALPIFTFGLSSGGSFAALLGGLFPERIAGVASFISVGSAPFYRSVKSQESVPMVMVLMQRDSAMMERSDKALQMCQENKKHCHRFTVASHNLDANSFTFEPLMTSAESKAVFERLQETSMLDPESGAALTSVSPSDLAPLLPDILCPQYAGVESQSLVNKAALPMDISEEPILRKFHLQLGLIKQVINRAFGFHEASAEHFADAMAWLWDHKAH